MTVMIKRWYRTRKNQVLILIAILLCIVYYISLNGSLHREPDLDLTRSLSHVISTAPVLNSSCVRTVPNKNAPRNITKVKEPDINNRKSVLEYIENRLEEALRTDKGTGCEIPKLDPFAWEVTQFDKALPKVVCQGQDWVKCYKSECRVVRQILNTTRDIVCSYHDIVYHSDNNYTVESPVEVEGTGAYILTRSDHVKIKCVGTHEKSLIKSKWVGHGVGFRTEVDRKPLPRGREAALNVLIFGFDSTSKNGFIRKMPKSYKYLTKELKGTVLNGYNIVGDGTPAALFPIMTGKTELELPDVRKKMKNNGTLDSMPFIFYKLKEAGYRTAYFEDMPWIGTFQYRFNGFRRQPADHYLRAFFLEESGAGRSWWRNSGARYCVGDTPRHQLMMDITQQFLSLDGKRFCFTFVADITHDEFNMISTADDAFVSFLQEFKAKGLLQDTMLMVMGDHGPRFAKVRDTFQGKLEERLPLMTIVLPEDLKMFRPWAEPALQANAAALTTPHDIHATVLDVLDMTSFLNPYRVKGADLPRGMSLLKPIPRNRSCSEAGIEPHWCACVAWQNVSSTEPMYHRTANAFVDYINELTEPVRSKCVPRTLVAVAWVQRQQANRRLLAFAGAKDADGYVGRFDADVAVHYENYQLKVAVGPSKGVYEASVTFSKKDDKFLFNTRDISRINAYRNQPSCISTTHPHLNKFCYCKDHV